MASKKLMEQRALAKAAERAAAEEWICSRCAATNVGTDVFCMNVIKSGARCMRGGAARWCRGVTFACVCVWSGSREVGPPRGEKTRVCGTDKPRLFHPHISRAARHLQRPAGHVEALTQYQMNERAARLRQAEADKEKLPSECTFAPRINSNSKKLARLHRVKEEAKVRARACGAAGWPCPRHAHAQLTVGLFAFRNGCPPVPACPRWCVAHSSGCVATVTGLAQFVGGQAHA